MGMCSRFVFATFLLATCSVEANAGIMVTFFQSSPNPIVAGSTATIDVLLTGNPTDTLDFFLAEFVITSGTGPVGGLHFADPQDYAYLNANDYVFKGVSRSYFDLLSFGSVPGSLSPDQTRYSVGDYTDDLTKVPPDRGQAPVNLSATPFLLARLLVKTAPAVSGTYMLSLSTNPSHTVFADKDGIDLVLHTTPITLTVGSSFTSIPEPTTSLAAAACLFAAVMRSRGLRHRRTQHIS
jgi:hypothetical protein